SRLAASHAPHTRVRTRIGPKRGELQKAVLPYHTIGDDIVVIGSLAGGPKNPNWVGNIRGEPRCWVHVKRRFLAATARIVTGEERRALLERCIAERPIVKSYD